MCRNTKENYRYFLLLFISSLISAKIKIIPKNYLNYELYLRGRHINFNKKNMASKE